MTNKTIGAFEAKTHFSELLAQAQQGQAFVITKNGKPVADLRPHAPVKAKRLIGCMKGEIKIADDFDAPLDDFKDYQ
jgi:prevent-host-death family protein